MGILERQLLTRQTIQSDLFCAKCGYNLRTRPTIGRCSECGNEYNADPVRMTGILRDEDLEFPVAAWGLFLLSGGLGAAFIYARVSWKLAWSLAPAVFMILLAVGFAIVAVVKSRVFFRHAALVRRTFSKR